MTIYMCDPYGEESEEENKYIDIILPRIMIQAKNLYKSLHIMTSFL